MNTIYNNLNINRLLKVTLFAFALIVTVYFYINFKVVHGVMSFKKLNIEISKLSSDILEREKDLSLLRSTLSEDYLVEYSLAKANDSIYIVRDELTSLSTRYGAE